MPMATPMAPQEQPEKTLIPCPSHFAYNANVTQRNMAYAKRMLAFNRHQTTQAGFGQSVRGKNFFTAKMTRYDSVTTIKSKEKLQSPSIEGLLRDISLASLP